jgi:hypothetical protein
MFLRLGDQHVKVRVVVRSDPRRRFDDRHDRLPLSPCEIYAVSLE